MGCDDKHQERPSKQQHDHTQPSPPAPKPQKTFLLSDVDGRMTTATLKEGRLSLAKVTQKLILINLFAPWSPPSSGMVPYLNALQQQYPKDIFVIGLMVHSAMDTEKLRHYMLKQNASYFISKTPDSSALALALVKALKLPEDYPVPVTILFKDGRYTLHYIGATPMEMIQSDIEQLRR